MKLKRTNQCKNCPWKVSVNPHDIPRGYSEDKHKALESTIADPDNPTFPVSSELRMMACHETHDAHCIGWLHNQLGEGNNIALRLSMVGCENASKIKLDGEQHKCFEDTLPN